MTRKELLREVARATGETARTIARRGFSLLHPRRDGFDIEPYRPPLVVDWDAVERRRAARSSCAA